MTFIPGKMSEARQAGYEKAEEDVKHYSEEVLERHIQMKQEHLEYARTPPGCELTITQIQAYLERVQLLRQRKPPDQEVFDVLAEVFRRVRRDTLAPSVLEMYCTLHAFYPSFYEQHQLIMSDLSRFLDLYYYKRVGVSKGWPS